MDNIKIKSTPDNENFSKNKDWASPLSVLKSVGPKLVPFLKTLGMYFVIFIPVDRPSWFGMLIKCLPIISLCLFILLHGISFSDEHTFARRILAGLFLSCIGDAFLVWPSYFLHGMLFFSIAQVFYIKAFGFEHPLNWTLGLIIYGITSMALFVIMPGVMDSHISLIIGVPFYAFILTTMVWRAVSRVQFFEDLWTWTKLCSCFGGIFFVISDVVLGLNRFYTDIPHSQAIIMITYFIAQLGMALSVVNSKDDHQKKMLEELKNSPQENIKVSKK